jgi:hypothetical protein
MKVKFTNCDLEIQFEPSSSGKGVAITYMTGPDFDNFGSVTRLDETIITPLNLHVILGVPPFTRLGYGPPFTVQTIKTLPPFSSLAILPSMFSPGHRVLNVELTIEKLRKFFERLATVVPVEFLDTDDEYLDEEFEDAAFSDEEEEVDYDLDNDGATAEELEPAAIIKEEDYEYF